MSLCFGHPSIIESDFEKAASGDMRQLFMVYSNNNATALLTAAFIY